MELSTSSQGSDESNSMTAGNLISNFKQCCEQHAKASALFNAAEPRCCVTASASSKRANLQQSCKYTFHSLGRKHWLYHPLLVSCDACNRVHAKRSLIFAAAQNAVMQDTLQKFSVFTIVNKIQPHLPPPPPTTHPSPSAPSA